MDVTIYSRGGASALPHAALPHTSAAAPAVGVAAVAAFLNIAATLPEETERGFFF